MSTTTRISSLCDILADLREQHAALFAAVNPENGTTAEQTSAILQIESRIEAVKQAQNRLHNAYESAWDAAHKQAPRQMRRNSNGSITTLTSAMGGGRAITVFPGDDGYEAASAEVDRRTSLDGLVAEVAFAAWGWRGAVRIDYYGGDIARVTNGGRIMTVRLSELA